MTRNDPSPRLRALVLEDEWVARSYLTELVEASGLAGVVAAVATVDQARQALAAPPQGVEVDVAFLDVHLAGPAGGQAGLELARELSAMPGAPALVLATAFAEHALEAFDLGAVDYLRKPFTAERVVRCLRRVQASRSPRPTGPFLARVVARKGKSLVFLGLEEVWAFEAAGRLVTVHGERGTMDMDLSLAALEAQLAGRVLRVHRNWLVNLSKVLELTRDGAETRLTLGAPGPSAPEAPRTVVVPVTRERAAEVRATLLARLSAGGPADSR